MFSKESMAMLSEPRHGAVEQEEQEWRILTPISEGEVTDVLRGMGATVAGLDKIELKDLL